MRILAIFLAAAASVAFGQYKMEPLAGPPSEITAAYSAVLQAQGAKILTPAGAVWCEIWLGKALPAGTKSAEDAVALPTIPHGALLAVVRFPANGADRRGQTIKPGIYTMRYSLFPVNGDHQGVAPQRDFAILSKIADDADPAALPKYDTLMALSVKASGTPHPLVLSIYPSSAEKTPSFAKEGERDWALHQKIGAQPVAIILVGKAEG